MQKIGLNPNLLEYTKYNFIDYNMLYSDHFYAYDAIFSDIIAWGIYNHCKNLDYRFDQLISTASSIKEINFQDLIDTFNLDTTELLHFYIMEINHFLEEVKHDYFKEK